MNKKDTSYFFGLILVALVACNNQSHNGTLQNQKTEARSSPHESIDSLHEIDEGFASSSEEDVLSANRKGPFIKNTKPFLVAPIPTLKIPFEKQRVLAEKGATFTFKSGASINFPAKAFVDENGEVINGEVQISLREFINPLDFFLAGLPMNFDSAGTAFTFESAGMFEINAQYQGKAAFVNPTNQPILSLKQQRLKPGNSIYYLDTLARKWLPSQEKLIKVSTTIVKVIPIESDSGFSLNRTVPRKPVKPAIVEEDKPMFDVFIPYADAYEELGIFSKAKFQIDDSEKNYNPAEADKEWDKVDLKPTQTEGVYNISFSTSKIKISYRVRPVYQGEDFDAALQEYLVKKDEYEQMMKEWLAAEERRKKAWADQEKAEGVKAQFALNSFGIWNCDRLIYGKRVRIVADFINSEGKSIALTNINLVNQEVNGLFSFNSNEISLDPKKAYAIWGFLDKKLYYRSMAEVEPAIVANPGKVQKIQVREFRGALDDYQSLKQALGL